MRRPWLWLAIALLFVGPLTALAQEDGEAPPPPQMEGGGEGGDNGGGGQPGDQQGGGEEKENPAVTQAMSLDDAKVNMFTLIQSFLTARQIDGVWPLKAKGAKAALLMLVLVDDEMRKVRALGTRKYRGIVGFLDTRANKDYDAEFTVDLSGSEWKVLSMGLKPVPKRKVKKKKVVVETPAGEDDDAEQPASKAPDPNVP